GRPLRDFTRRDRLSLRAGGVPDGALPRSRRIPRLPAVCGRDRDDIRARCRLQPVGGCLPSHRAVPADDCPQRMGRGRQLRLQPEWLLGLVGLYRRRLSHQDGAADTGGEGHGRSTGAGALIAKSKGQFGSKNAYTANFNTESDSLRPKTTPYWEGNAVAART